MEHILTEPYTKEKTANFRAGDTVLISGTIYTARDAAHEKLQAMIENGEKLPFEIEDAILYYVGPTPAREGHPIGSAGPTTSCRMDRYTPLLLEKGLLATMGKGPRGEKVIETGRKTGAVYLAAIGGAAALIAQCVESAEVVAFEELGTEAVRKLKVRNFPAVVAIDRFGNNIYNT